MRLLRPPRRTLLAMTAVVASHVYLGLGPIRDSSPTYDEPVHLTAGYVVLKTGRYLYNGLHHPPFGEMWAALPLLFMKPILPTDDENWRAQTWRPLEQYHFADRFLYHNRVPAEALMAAARKMQVALSVLLGVGVGAAGFILSGPAAALITLAFWGFSPEVLAHGTLVSTDLAFSAFFFLFFFLWGIRNGRRGRAAVAAGAGAALGLCFASKYLAISILPILGVLLFYKAQRPTARETILMGITAAVVLALVYRFSGLEIFGEGLGRIVGRSQAGRSSFFWGRHGAEDWLLYFPFVLAVKTTLPLLMGLITALVLVARRRFDLPPFLWIPPLVLFGLACVSKVQIGHRHLLAIYPFLFVMAGLGLSKLAGPWRALAPALVLWQAVTVIKARPHFLAYFNEIAGGPAQGYRYLTDSNVDWGQGLKLLASHLDETDKKRGIYLCYFGTADPHAYGIRYLDVGSDSIAGHADDSRSSDLAPVKLAISATNLQGTYYADPAAFDWLKAYTPAAVVAHSIFVYDFSNDPMAVLRLETLRRGEL